MQDDLRGQVARYRWYHSIDLGNGVVTPGRKSFATCTAEAHAIFGRVDLSGRTVLDVGAWNGFFSFEAKRRGAARVLATDSVAWTRPRDGMREPFDLARSVLGLDVEAREIDVAQLSTDTVGEFDIVLYLGVFYHRQDAIEALARVARLARQLLIVETHLDLRDIDRPAMAFYPGDELLGDKTNWWGPNERCMKALLHGHDFAEVEFAEHPAGPARGIFHAWRSTSARIEPLVEAAPPKPAPPKPAPPKPAPPKPAPLNVRSKIIREIRRPFRRFFT